MFEIHNPKSAIRNCEVSGETLWRFTSEVTGDIKAC
jgi:hypothetical protein